LLQGNALPIVGLNCCLMDNPDHGDIYITDSNGEISGMFEAGVELILGVYSETNQVTEPVLKIELASDEYMDQYFSAIVDLVKIECETQPHPESSMQYIYPDINKTLWPTNKAPKSSTGYHPQNASTLPCNDPNGNPNTKVNHQNAILISIDNMKTMWFGISRNVSKISELQQIADELNANISKYKLDTPLRKAHFFAQVMEEAGAKLSLEESLNYTPKALVNNFSYFKKNKHEADLLGHTTMHPANQQAIANKIYSKQGNDQLGNGDVASGDGWRYRGRGLKQVTGRFNYAIFTSEYKKIWSGESVDFILTPDLLAHIKYATRSAVWFWLHHKLYNIADRGMDLKIVDEITAIVNKNTRSYEKRRQHFKLTQKVFR